MSTMTTPLTRQYKIVIAAVVALILFAIVATAITAPARAKASHQAEARAYVSHLAGSPGSFTRLGFYETHCPWVNGTSSGPVSTLAEARRLLANHPMKVSAAYLASLLDTLCIH